MTNSLSHAGESDAKDDGSTHGNINVTDNPINQCTGEMTQASPSQPVVGNKSSQKVQTLKATPLEQINIFPSTRDGSRIRACLH